MIDGSTGGVLPEKMLEKIKSIQAKIHIRGKMHSFILLEVRSYTVCCRFIVPGHCILLLLKVKSMQRLGTEAIRTQIQPSKPQNGKYLKLQKSKYREKYGQESKQLFPKMVATQQLKPN